MLKYIGHALRTITGFYQKEFSKHWDSILDDLIDNGEVIEIRTHNITIMKDNIHYTIWHSNEYYAYAHLWRVDDKKVDNDIQFRPRFKTMLKFEAFIERILLDDFNNRAGLIYK